MERNCSRSRVFELLPPDIERLGQELLGSQLAEYRRRLVVTKTELLGNVLCLAHLSSDDTLKQLRQERKNDYGLARLVSPSTTDLIFDIGANMGEFSIAASRHASKARVVTIEPIPPTYWILRINLWLNGVDTLPESTLLASEAMSGVIPIHAAIGSSADAASKPETQHVAYYSLFRKSQAAFTSRERRASSLFSHGFYGGWKSRLVPVRSVDGLAGGQKVAMLKMDCEGCEFEALGSIPHAFFASKERVEHVVGEMHWGMVRVNKTARANSVSGSSGTAADRTVAALQARGCALRGDELKLGSMDRKQLPSKRWGGALPVSC